MNGLDRLQKEIDALTYNSRTVLNALIRSVTASGNSNGFKVTRAGETIYLSRIDIYRIYKFYEEWQVNNFSVTGTEQPNVMGFDKLLAKHDATPVTVDNNVISTNATTSALVNHSKILFKTTTNSTNTNQGWLDLIKFNDNAKLVSNSAPIPLNLRTPVFDENLSTAHYNSHPTYLFPMGYFTRDILGYSGDDTAHELDGKSWIVNADDFIRLSSNKISLGDVIPEATYKTADNRTGNYAFSFGYDCHAQAEYSVSGGRSSIVPVLAADTVTQITYTAIAIGTNNIASNIGSSSIGGLNNSVSNKFGAILGGSNNIVTAEGGCILGGINNTVGGKVYPFTIKNVNTTGDGLHYAITISGNVSSSFNLSKVVLFDFKFYTDEATDISYWTTHGNAIQAIEDEILSAAYDSTTENTTLTLKNGIPTDKSISSGYISITAFYSSESRLGKYSGAIGSDLIAEGMSQVVVGKSNKVQRNARFIVGNGVSAGSRSNSFEVYDTGFIAYTTPDSTQSFASNKTPSAAFTGMRFARVGDDSSFTTLVGLNRFKVYKEAYSGNTNGFEYTGSVGVAGGAGVGEFSIKAGNTTGIGLRVKNTIASINLNIGADEISTFSVGTGDDAKGNANILSSKKIYIQGKTGVYITGGTTTQLYVSETGFNATFNGISLLSIDSSASIGTTVYSRMTLKNTLNTTATEFTIDNTDIKFNDPDVIIRLKNSAATGYSNAASMSFIAYEHPDQSFCAGNTSDSDDRRSWSIQRGTIMAVDDINTIFRVGRTPVGYGSGGAIIRNTIPDATVFCVSNKGMVYDDVDVIMRLENSPAVGNSFVNSMTYSTFEHPTQTFVNGNFKGQYWGVFIPNVENWLLDGLETPLLKADADKVTVFKKLLVEPSDTVSANVEVSGTTIGSGKFPYLYFNTPSSGDGPGTTGVARKEAKIFCKTFKLPDGDGTDIYVQTNVPTAYYTVLHFTASYFLVDKYYLLPFSTDTFAYDESGNYKLVFNDVPNNATKVCATIWFCEGAAV